MSRIESLKENVRKLYLAKNPSRADWADWLFQNHIFIVADYAGTLADRFEANKDLVVAASILHDIADAVMRREEASHEQRSMEIAEQYLAETGFSSEEIDIIIHDAIRFHSCQNGESPQTLEGKIMATADALAHLQTNFYDYALGKFTGIKNDEEIRQWALPKIERDFYKKIFFKEIQEEARPGYERVKKLFI